MADADTGGEPRPFRRLIVTAIVAAAVGAGIGVAAGYQLGEEPSTVPAARRSSRLEAPYGSVTSVTGGSFTITSFGREVEVETDDATVIARAGGATLDEIEEGETIIVSGEADADGVVQANEIVVLPKQWLFLLG
jgi:Domain of unknown function (DUF5666)